MWLIAGLGNPGASYATHRHNVGFMLADAIAQTAIPSHWSRDHQAELLKLNIGNSPCILCKPQTFMNKSGDAVSAIARYYKIPTEQILVMIDELDLPLGKLRVKKGGGAGGHNGIRHIDQHLGQDYWRLRFGIGHPGNKQQVHNYVLSPFSMDETMKKDALIKLVVEHLPLFFTHSPEMMMSRVHEAIYQHPLFATAGDKDGI